MTLEQSKKKKVITNKQFIRIVCSKVEVNPILINVVSGFYNYRIDNVAYGQPFEAFVGGASNAYTFNKATKQVFFTSGSPVSSINPFTINFYLFATTETGVYKNLDLDDINSEVIFWKPYLLNQINISNTISNFRYGLPTKTNINASFSNELGLYKYSSIEYSFYNKEVKIWQEFDENIELIYTGVLDSFNFNNIKSTLSIKPFVSNLKEKATFGLNGFATGSISNSQKNLKRTFFFGKQHYAPFKSSQDGLGFYVCSDQSDSDFKYEAICKTYSTAKSDSTNRTWELGLINGNISTQDIAGKPIVRVLKNRNYYQPKLTNQRQQEHVLAYIPTATKVELGTTVTWVEAGNQIYGTVIRNTNFSYNGLTYNFIFLQDYLHPTFDFMPISTSSSFTNLKNVGLVIRNKQGGITTASNAFQSLEYTLNEVVEGDFTRISAIFTSSNNALANNQSNLNNVLNEVVNSTEVRKYITPDDYNVFPLIYQSFNSNHNDVVEKLSKNIFGAGKLNLQSYSQSFIDLASQLSFTIPEIEEKSINTYEYYLKKILQSVYCVLFFDKNGLLNYKVISPKVATKIRDNNKIIDSSFNASVSYKEIFNDISFKNKHIDFIQSNDISSFNVVDNTSIHLHGRLKKLNIPTYLVETDSAMRLRLLSFFNNRQLKINIKTAFIDIDTALSEFIKIENNLISADFLVTSFNKTKKETTLSLDDLGV